MTDDFSVRYMIVRLPTSFKKGDDTIVIPNNSLGYVPRLRGDLAQVVAQDYSGNVRHFSFNYGDFDPIDIFGTEGIEKEHIRRIIEISDWRIPEYEGHYSLR